MVIKILSSGQTGVDRAALDVALENDIACGGWCSKGRHAEDGPIDSKYPLVETTSPSPTQRAESNVRDSNGTLILSWGALTSSTLKTAAIAARLKRPLLVVNLNETPKVEAVEAWANHFHIRVLNITGPKTSEVADAYEQAKTFLQLLLVGPAPE